MDFYDNTEGNSNSGYTPTNFNDFSDANDPNPFVGAVPITDEATLFSRVFSWMFAGLGISAISAFVGAGALQNGLISMGLFYGLIILELALVIFFSLKLQSMSATTAKICFIAYSIVNGFTLSTVLLVYTGSSVISTFVAAAAIFGAAALFGKVTNKNLSSIGGLLVMGLFGIIVASIINLFVRSGPFDMIISFIGIALFIGITAWDSQRIRDFAKQQGLYDESTVSKVVIWGALQLYLDFINIFLKLLRFMGNRKN